MPSNQDVKIYNDLPTVDIPSVEVFSEGSWNGDRYTGEDLQAMIDAFDKVGFEPTVKAGHADGQDNLGEKEYRKIFGAPALGYVARLYRKGSKLVADLKQVPRHFANLIKAGSYKRVSSEIYWNYKDEAGGRTYPRVLKSIAFLGAEIPALPNLKAVEALFHRNDAGLVFAYEGGREFRMYEMDKDYQNDATVMEKDGKWCVYKAGKKVSEHKSKEEAMAAMGSAPLNKNPTQEKMKMDEKEFQAKIDAAVAAAIDSVTKEYEKKTAEAVASVKAEADAEKKELAERVAMLEKQNRDAVNSARNARIDSRIDKIFDSGKMTATEKEMLKSLARALPEAATHKYGQGDKEVVEPCVETLFKIFEGRKTSLFSEVTKHHNEEVRSYSDAQSEVVKRANELIQKSDGKLDMIKAYSQVQKDDPELWDKYQSDVRGSH